MSFIGWYILFCITTALTASFELLNPVVKQQHEEVGHIDSLMVTYIVFFLLTTAFAPFIFFSCIIPSMGTRFRKSLHKGLFPKE